MNALDMIRFTDAAGTERWSARDLMDRLGYDRWENFDAAVDRAKAALANAEGISAAQDHFRDATKMIEAGKGATRRVADYDLSRYGAYLVAMNGDPRKPEIAAAQTYFAQQTRKAEIAQNLLASGDALGMVRALLGATNDHDALLARLADAERRLAALEARPAQARLFALPSARPKPVPVNHGAVVARKAEQRTKAIAAIAEGHGSSIRQLALFLNLSWYTAHAIVAKLVKDGTVTAEQDVANHNAIALRVVA